MRAATDFGRKMIQVGVNVSHAELPMRSLNEGELFVWLAAPVEAAAGVVVVGEVAAAAIAGETRVR